MTQPLSKAPDTFQAATWNVLYSTPIRELEPILGKLLDQGVDLFYFQESEHPGFTDMLDRAGLHWTHSAQWTVAWEPDLWHKVAAGSRQLSDLVFHTASGHRAVSGSQWAILSDNQGRTLTALSYHTPAHVQVMNPPALRLRVLEDSMATLRDLGAQATTRAVLFAGDDNVDERMNPLRWPFMLRPFTGLKLVQAPTGTLGSLQGRRIDDFRVRGRVRVGKGRTLPGGGDHRIHVRAFTWR